METGDVHMPRAQISEIVLQTLDDHHAHDIQEIVETIQGSAPANEPLYASDVKSAVLGMVRRNEIELTDDFKVKLPVDKLVTA
jgi:hypothetical protein